MKKLSIALLILLVLISSAAQADVMKHVADQANTFTDREIEKLEARMTGIYDVYGFDTVIVTTRDSRGQTAQMYAADFYDEFRDYDAYPNGLIFSFNFDIGEYYEETRGMGMELFSDQGEGALDSLLRPYLDEPDYFGAMTAYLDSVEKTLSRHSTPGEGGKRILSTTLRLPTFSEAMAESAGLLPFMLIGGIAIGFAAAFVMRGKLNLARPQGGAQRYTSPNSLRLRDTSDIYLYQTVSRTKIQSNNSSSGGGSGGGARFNSSSGRSYGGRGGKL